MRLLHTRDFTFKEFVGGEIPPYAIISHRWSSEEVSHQDFLENRKAFLKGRCKGYGWLKITKGCRIASSYRYDWVWIDTICIDKKSSAELSEAINSMFRWYRNSGTCYVFLPDVHPIRTSSDDGSTPKFSVEEFQSSQWFTRAWTLQELIAPRAILFFNSDFQLIGDKNGLKYYLSEATGISKDHLLYGILPSYTPVAVRMRWASKRVSTRVEDMAYSLIGIFDINMPLLYGEGKESFRRLQIEIIRQSDDESIFFWERNYSPYPIVKPESLLASDASCFSNVYDYHISRFIDRQHYEITNKGIRVICNVPSDLIQELSRRARRSAIILMPLNLSKLAKNRLGEWRHLVPCLRVKVKAYQSAIRSTSNREFREVRYLDGSRESLEVVSLPGVLDDRHIELAAEHLKTLEGHSWDAFCGNDDVAQTAIPVYFRIFGRLQGTLVSTALDSNADVGSIEARSSSGPCETTVDRS